MTIKSESKIEYLYVVDDAVDEVGEVIEHIYPILCDIDPRSDEYRLLNNIWVDWCKYLEYAN